MASVIWVGLGGFVGAVLRYAMGFFPFEGDLPLATLLINLIGYFLIGVIAELALRDGALSHEAVLFLKTGLCGGFTTFSTFSLETLSLFEGGRIALGIGYAGLSFVLCVAGVLAGKAVVSCTATI